MDRLKSDASNPDLALVRQVMFKRLRDDQRDPNQGWRQLEDDNGKGFERYVELPFNVHYAAQTFSMCVIDVFWELVSEGIVAPGLNASNRDLPWFHLTAYGRRAIADEQYQPHDRMGYLARLQSRIPTADATVIAYVAESLETFVRGNFVASMVMLGVAAERVFDLLSESLARALTDPREQATFAKLLQQYAMKPKIDWVHDKLRRIQEQRPRPSGCPENSALMVTAIYDLIRSQRNDLGHPRDTPPRMSRGDANANLEIFPRYYETAEELRAFLAANNV